MAYRPNELFGTTCPAPNLVSATALSNTVVLASFDRNMIIPDAGPFTIDGGASSRPSVLLATPVTARQVTLTTSPLDAQPYELICAPTMTDTRGRALAQRAAPFTGIAPGPGGCSPVVISEVYPGGGNTGATLNADYVELKNRTSQAVSLVGWTLHYQSASSTTWTSAFSLSGTLQPGGVLVIQAGGAGANGAVLMPDLIWSQVLSATGAKIALVAGLSPGVACPAPGTIADLVGYGTLTAACSEASPTTAPGSAQALSRVAGRCQDTNVNVADFALATPSPRGNLTPCSLSCTPDGG
jgi:hypothetical protein